MTSDEQWKPCDTGTIQDLVDTQRRTERRDVLTRRAVFSGAAVSVAGAALFMVNRFSTPAPLTCDGVRELAARYVSGTLDDAQVAMVDTHLSHCRPCASHISELS